MPKTEGVPERWGFSGAKPRTDFSKPEWLGTLVRVSQAEETAEHVLVRGKELGVCGMSGGQCDGHLVTQGGEKETSPEGGGQSRASRGLEG